MYSKDQVIQIIEADRQKLENAMADIVPPATQRERWMYQQGRLAERDPRTPGSLAYGMQQCGEPVDGYALAMKVREDLDRQACPDFYMTTAVESIVRHLASPLPQQPSGAPIKDKEVCDEQNAIHAQQILEGYKLVPIEPTEEMIVEGFESAPDEHFTPKDEWERFQAMSGCQQAAHKARLCWKAMIKAAPKP